MEVNGRLAVLGFLGPCGTYSEAAAVHINELLGYKWQLKPYHSIVDVLVAADKGLIDYCVVPVENSLEGSVRVTLDTLALDVDLQVSMEFIWPIRHQLLVKEKKTRIDKIVSHSQALSQCRRFLQQYYPDTTTLETSSTAYAAEMVADGLNGAAAVASARAAEIYGLIPIFSDIQDDDDNVTRFMLLNKKGHNIAAGPNEKMLIVCRMDGRKAGSLCDILLEFAKYDVNMTHIESRPSKKGLGNYMFFFEIDIAAKSQNIIDKLLTNLNDKCLWLKNMGMFPVIK